MIDIDMMQAERPTCSNCGKLGINCVFARVLNSEAFGEASQQAQVRQTGGVLNNGFFHSSHAPAATWTCGPSDTSTTTNHQSSIGWNLMSMPGFAPNLDLLHSSTPDPDFLGNSIAPSHAMLDSVRIRDGMRDNGKYRQSTKRRHSMLHQEPSSREISHHSSNQIAHVQQMFVNDASEEPGIASSQIKDNSELHIAQNSSNDITEFSDSIVSDAQASANLLPVTSATSKDRLPDLHIADALSADNVKLAQASRLKRLVSLMPPKTQLLELLRIFLVTYHPLLPCMHNRRFTERVQKSQSIESEPLIWAILAVAAPDHHDRNTQSLHHCWLSRAKLLFEKELDARVFPTRALQAAVWIVFEAYVSGNITEAWFFLGKACRLAQMLGFDRIDSDHGKKLISLAPRPRDAIEVEERRKVVWALFYLDRTISCLAGFALAIDDRYFQVNYPLDDELFQELLDNVSHGLSGNVTNVEHWIFLFLHD